MEVLMQTESLRKNKDESSPSYRKIIKMLKDIRRITFSTDDQLATYIETSCSFLAEQQYNLQPSNELFKLVFHILRSCPSNIQKSFIMIFCDYGILTHFQTETLFFHFNLMEA